MNVLVLGGAGLLGQDLCAALASRGYPSHPVDREEVDITEPGAVAAAIVGTGATQVVNCAAYTAVDQAESERDEAFRINVEGARLAAAQAAAAGVSFLQLSTDYVFDGGKEVGYVESDELAPLSVYGASKAAGEQAVLDAHPSACVVRTQWLFGLGGPNFVETMLRLGAERGDLSVVDDQFGSPTWTADLACGLVWLLEEGASGRYHLTNSGTTSWCGFAREVFKLAGLDVAVQAIPTDQFPRPAARPAFGILRNERWVAEGHQALRSWREALASYLVARKEEQ